jgi:ribonuclease BN (tRNA processing enzyme)
MKIEFLGTRGEIESSTRRHKRHSSLMIHYLGRRVMIDCGKDWLGELDKIKPQAIVITHAHPDHVLGLEEGAPCPVYATVETWDSISKFQIERREVVRKQDSFVVRGIQFEAFTVEHSTRSPAVGYRVTAGKAVIFYAPDVVYIHNREDALRGADLYVGDCATIARSMVRKRGDQLIGHTPVRTQLTWCQKEGVQRAIFTHCGSQLVNADERSVLARIRAWGKERGVDARIAHDGMEVVLR